MGVFAGITPETVDDLYAGAIAADPARPVLTWYDDRTGERIELSGVTLDNWIVKTANLVVDGCGLGAGDRAAVLLPPHWQTAAVLLGCWRAGLTVAAPAGPGSATGDPVASADVLFSAVPGPGDAPDDAPDTAPGTAVDTAVDTAGDRFALGLAPLGAPLRVVPDGFVDYVAEVRGHGDRFTSYQPVLPTDPARPGQSHRDLCAAAHRRAAELGIGAGARVLIDAAAYPDPVDWLLAPLAAGASVVLCAGLVPGGVAARVATERVTVTLVTTP